MSEQTKTVFVVDDELMVLAAVEGSIKSLGCEVKCFQAPAQCIDALKNEAPCHLLVSDVNMPEIDGVQLLEKVKELRPLLPVIFITGFGSVQLAVKAVKLGALNYIEKPLDEDVFLPIISEALEQVSFDSGLVTDSLTDVEKQVVALVAEGHSNKQIAHMIDRSIRTVENHRQRIQKKLNLSSSADLVKVAVRLGLKTGT